MPIENRVSVVLTPELLEQCGAAINTLTAALSPLLLSISKEERQALPKMSDKTIPFVDKVIEYSQSNPEFTPPFLNMVEMKVDVKAVDDMLKLYHPLEQLLSKMNDTVMLSGSEAYTAALTYYNTVKQATAMNVPGAKVIYNDLKKRFEKNSAPPLAPENA